MTPLGKVGALVLADTVVGSATGAFAGAVASVIVALITTGGAIWLTRRKSNKDRKADDTPAPSPDPNKEVIAELMAMQTTKIAEQAAIIATQQSEIQRLQLQILHRRPPRKAQP